MRKVTILAFAVCLLAFPVLAQQKFVPSCDLPSRFAAIAEHHDIDDECPVTGNDGSNPAKQAESSAKNNFCATGTPVVIGVDSFKNLQKKSDAGGKGFGNKADRSELHDLSTAKGQPIGEGALVRFAGFIIVPTTQTSERVSW
jgi:hypothetical protein